MTEPTAHTLDVPGATLTYNVRKADTGDAPVLFMIGSPMGLGGLVTLAGHFPDRTVVIYDPRGRRTQHEGRSGQPVDAGGVRRRPAVIDRRSGGTR